MNAERRRVEEIRYCVPRIKGSIVVQSDSAGNSQATYAYGPYGEPLTASGSPAWGASRYRYTGQIELTEARLYHYKARAYDPTTGRFLQTDPIGLQSDVNLYAYATEDPINSSDPSGTDCISVDIPGLPGSPSYSSDCFSGGGFLTNVSGGSPGGPPALNIPSNAIMTPGSNSNGITVSELIMSFIGDGVLQQSPSYLIWRSR